MRKVFKKAISLLLVSVMVFGSAPLAGFVGLDLPEFSGFKKFADSVSDFIDGFATKAEAATYSGTCGDNLTWTFDETTGELIISGTGNMKNFNNQNYNTARPWKNIYSKIKTISLSNGITSIGTYAFWGCYNLVNITMPNSITSIGDWAFRYCDSLTSITIPDYVTSIGESAFCDCTGLTNIKVDPGNTTYSSDECGVLFNKDKTELIQYPIGNTRTNYTIPDSVISIGNYAFYCCYNLTSITIPNNVTSIGDWAFTNCHSLTSITIPNNVTSIDDYAFGACHSLTSITIPNSVTSIGDYAFSICNGLTSVTIGNSVTSIGDDAFWCCDSLTGIKVDPANTAYSSDEYGVLFNKDKTELIQYPIGNTRTNYTIPENVTNIGDSAFEDCNSLTSVTIPDSVISIDSMAFLECSSLTDVYYTSTEEEWNTISIDGTGNESLLNATIHYNTSTEDLPSDPNKKVSIVENIVFLDIGEQYQFAVYDGNETDITDNVVWGSSTSVDSTGEVEFVDPGKVKATKDGLTLIMADYFSGEPKQLVGFDSCYVFVGDPSEIKYHSISDTIYYYGENAFYSDACQFSDSVDIYISLKNAIHDQIEFLTEYDKYADELETIALNGYTLTASVSGSSLSFDKNEYINSYTSAADTDIPIDKAVDELLTLYPYNLDVGSEDKNFTVTIKIESEDFETFTDSFTFKISSLEDKEINEHISFIDSNGTYKAMRDNDFATGMTDLKNDSQYIWSKYSTLDFENYYEVLMADIMVQLMGTQLTGNISLLPALKEWADNYKKILDNITTIVDNNYTGYMDVSKNALDKLFKKSQYVTEPNKVKDELRDTVIDLLGTTENIEEINTAFGYIDKTGQLLDFIDFGVNIANDIIDYVNCVSIMNSYKSMNDEFKNVIKKVYDCIPDDDWKVKDAVDHYVNLDTSAGYTKEIIESAIELAKDITLETYKSLFRKQIVSIFAKSIGSIKLASGALLSTTTAFSTITAGLGAVSTGATLGLCISDILCNNSGQAQEMGKVVAASALAPYVIQTMRYYEWALKNYKDESSLKHFETAFNLNKTLQIYCIEHTYKGLEVQANSLVIQLFSRRDYPGAMAELASLKTTHINCNCCEDIYTGVVKTKTIAIKCPVDVYIYDEYGKEVVRIINNIAEYVEDGINVFIYGREKYVTVPADQEYFIKIVATDEGTMDYLVIEHDENGRYKRIVNNPNIDLTKNQIFTGNICKEFDVNKESYAINTDDGVINPLESVYVSFDERSLMVMIKSPSTTTISYGDSIILHADLSNALPNGWYIKWTASNGNFDMDVSSDGTTCTISPSSSGDTIFTATVYDANDNVVSTDEQVMTSKAGFFDKIIAFFKKLFGLTKTIPQIYKGIY